MNQKLKYGLAFLLLGIASIIIFWPKPPEDQKLQEKKSPDRESLSRDSVQENPGNVPLGKNSLSAEELNKVEQAKGKSKLERMKELIRNDYNTPIDFWGKVVDQDGNPLKGVRAEIVVDEQAANKKYETSTNDEGLFQLLGKRGARARIKVFLDGYAPTSNEEIGTNISARTIYYAPKSKPMPAYAPPTRTDPQIFVLREKNPVANLAHSFKKRVLISKAGDAQKIELATAGKTIEMKVRCWSSSPVPFTYDRYDWRADIEISGGKLQAITDPEPIEAPVGGYEKVFKVEVSKDAEKTWKATNINQRDFWVQFDDGTYAKARIEVKTGRKHEVDAEVWYNLDGTNNFEQ